MSRIEEELSRPIVLDTIVSRNTARALISAAEETGLASVKILAKPGGDCSSYGKRVGVPRGKRYVQITAPNGVASQELWNKIKDS